MKLAKDGLDALPDIERLAAGGDWTEIGDDDAQRMKWYGLFLRKPTPGHFMMRVRSTCGHMTAAQWRLIAELSDRYGKGFCDLTTRQQVQMRWFTIGDVPRIWEQFRDVGLTSLQTGMDNVRGVCGCPAGGVTPNELFDATPIAQHSPTCCWPTRSSATCRASSTSRSPAASKTAATPRRKTSVSCRRCASTMVGR
jgi:ferredoxin-nitrite reductase